MKQWAEKQTGFTIVELLIVIVVIAILAAITIVAYNGIQTRARDSKVSTDLAQLSKAVIAARESANKTFMQVSGSNYSAGSCAALAAGTDLATLPSSDACWVRYVSTLNLISVQSGINVRGLLDPWGRPYKIDENEGESGGCAMDLITVFANPLNGGVSISKYDTRIPLSGYSGC